MQDFSGETAWWQSVSWVGSPWMSLVVAQLLLLLVLGLLWGFAHGCVCGLWFCCGETHWWPLCSLKAFKISALGAKCAFEYQHFLPFQRKQNSAGSCSAVFFSYGSSGLMAKTWSGRCCTVLKKSVCWFFPLGRTLPTFLPYVLGFLQDGNRVCTWTAEGHGWLCGTHAALPPSHAS